MSHSVSVSESRVEIRWLPRKTQCHAYVTITHALLFVRRWKSNEIMNLRVSFFLPFFFFIFLIQYVYIVDEKRRKKDGWNGRKLMENERGWAKEKFFLFFFIFIYLWLWLTRKIKTRGKVKYVIFFLFSLNIYSILIDKGQSLLS